MFITYLQPATLCKAKCHLAIGRWKTAIQAAEQVLVVDQINCKSLYIKAEALFNLCYFEHALLLFHRGQVRSSTNYREIYKMIIIIDAFEFPVFVINSIWFQYFYPDNDEFRLGIQKCRKTIQDAVSDSAIFKGESIETMFKMMRRVTEMRSIPKVGGKIFFPQTQKKKFTMSFAGVTTLVEAKEKQNKSKGKVSKISVPI